MLCYMTVIRSPRATCALPAASTWLHIYIRVPSSFILAHVHQPTGRPTSLTAAAARRASVAAA
jgi:hypothetical protein